jgi:hypothetical protein
MSKLEIIRKKAKTLGIEGTITPSDRQHKKYKITLDDGTVIHFGQVGYEDFLDHKDEKRRSAYLKRAKGIKDANGNHTANNKHSANFYAIRLLWG